MNYITVTFKQLEEALKIASISGAQALCDYSKINNNMSYYMNETNK